MNQLLHLAVLVQAVHHITRNTVATKVIVMMIPFLLLQMLQVVFKDYFEVIWLDMVCLVLDYIQFLTNPKGFSSGYAYALRYY